MAENQRLLKFTVFLYRKEGITEEEFNHHWSVNHAPIVTPWLKKHGIVRYVQYHTPSSMRNQLGEIASGALTSITRDYDGHAEFLMPSAKCFDEAIKDPYYLSHVKPDEERFFDPTRSFVIMGYEEQIF